MKRLFLFLLYCPWPSRLIRMGLGLVFVYAGCAKLLNLRGFARLVSQYDLIPDSWLAITAVGMPIFELLAGVGLILYLRGSLSLTLILLTFFVTVLWYGILKDLNVDCGCFATEDLNGQARLWQAFYRDLLMMGGILFLYGVKWVQIRREFSSQTALVWLPGAEKNWIRKKGLLIFIGKWSGAGTR